MSRVLKGGTPTISKVPYIRETRTTRGVNELQGRKWAINSICAKRGNRSCDQHCIWNTCCIGAIRIIPDYEIYIIASSFCIRVVERGSRIGLLASIAVGPGPLNDRGSSRGWLISESNCTVHTATRTIWRKCRYGTTNSYKIWYCSRIETAVNIFQSECYIIAAIRKEAVIYGPWCVWNGRRAYRPRIILYPVGITRCRTKCKSFSFAYRVLKRGFI